LWQKENVAKISKPLFSPPSQNYAHSNYVKLVSAIRSGQRNGKLSLGIYRDYSGQRLARLHHLQNQLEVAGGTGAGLPHQQHGATIVFPAGRMSSASPGENSLTPTPHNLGATPRRSLLLTPSPATPTHYLAATQQDFDGGFPSRPRPKSSIGTATETNTTPKASPKLKRKSSLHNNEEAKPSMRLATKPVPRMMSAAVGISAATKKSPNNNTDTDPTPM